MKLHEFTTNGVKVYIDFERDIVAAHVPEMVGSDSKMMLERFSYNGKVDFVGTALLEAKQAFLAQYPDQYTVEK